MGTGFLPATVICLFKAGPICMEWSHRVLDGVHSLRIVNIRHGWALLTSDTAWRGRRRVTVTGRSLDVDPWRRKMEAMTLSEF